MANIFDQLDGTPNTDFTGDVMYDYGVDTRYGLHITNHILKSFITDDLTSFVSDGFKKRSERSTSVCNCNATRGTCEYVVIHDIRFISSNTNIVLDFLNYLNTNFRTYIQHADMESSIERKTIAFKWYTGLKDE